MSTARNRTWKCPVCNKDARKFMIDSQQLDLIKRIDTHQAIPTEITFMKDGTIVIKVNSENDEENEDNDEG